MTDSIPYAIVIMPFNARMQGLYDELIKPAVERAGAKCERIDEQRFTGMILDQIYTQIDRADIVIAEITEPNLNVFYEVGYSHSRRKPTVLLKRATAEVPFDLAGFRHIQYNDGDPSRLTEELRDSIHMVLEKPGEAFASAYFVGFVDERRQDLSPKDLTFVAVADCNIYPVVHGQRVAELNRIWAEKQGDWEARSRRLEKLGLLRRNESGEVWRTEFGTAFVYVVLKMREYTEARDAIRTNESMATRWGIADAKIRMPGE